METLEQQIDNVWSTSNFKGNCSCWKSFIATREYNNNIKISRASKDKIWLCDEERLELECVEQTEQLIRQNLALALTSPSEYIREWARLITEEIRNQS